VNTLPRSTHDVQALTQTLTTLAEALRQRYPGDAKGIQRGLALAHTGKVEIVSTCLAFVASQSTDGVWYRLEGKHCSCQAHTIRCAHRWAASLLALAQNTLERARLDAQTATCGHQGYYATWTDTQHGRVVEGIAYQGEETWLFQDPTNGVTLAVPLTAIQLHGDVALADAQRAADGPIWQRLAHSPYAA
jgi:hypothetical protein